MIRCFITISILLVVFRMSASTNEGVIFRFSTMAPSGYGLMGAYGMGAFANYNFGSRLAREREDGFRLISVDGDKAWGKAKGESILHPCFTNILLCYTFEARRLYKIVLSGRNDFCDNPGDILKFKRYIFGYMKHYFRMDLKSVDGDLQDSLKKRYFAETKDFSIQLTMTEEEVSLSVISYKVALRSNQESNDFYKGDLEVRFDK